MGEIRIVGPGETRGYPYPVRKKSIWLVGCFGFNGPLRQYCSLYRAVSKEREKEERIDESKNVQTTPTRTYCKRSRSLPYCNPNCRTPRHRKFTQGHRTTRPPPARKAFLHKTVSCYFLLEPSHRDGCNKGMTNIYFINKYETISQN